MKAVYIEGHGGNEKLKYGEFEKPTAGAGQALVKLAASGVNYIDVYHREGLYKIPLPTVLGTEGAGVIESVGEGVTGFKPGDRVAYAMARGSYAEYQAVPANLLVHVPEGVDLKKAAAVMLQGMTAHYLVYSTFPLEKGQTALIHAAAGGTGRLLVQIAKMVGARVIATAGSPEKAAIAKSAGADEVLLYKDVDWVAEVKRLTDGKGVDVVYDGVGQATFLKGLDCLRPRGMMALFGQSSGPAAPFDPQLLNSKGGLFLTRPSLAYYLSPKELAWRSGDLFKWIGEGKLDILMDHIYPLSETAQAQRDLEARKTTGKLVITI